MGLLVPFIFILCMAYDTGGLDIVTEDSVLVKSAWIEYPASIDRLPQCCTSEDCQMVRISPSLLDQTKNTNNTRVRLTDKKQQISMIVSFDRKLGGLVGSVYREDSHVQLLKPLGLEERKLKPCYVDRQQKVIMGNFHKLQLYKSTLTDNAEPKFLFRSTLTPPTNKNTCCSGTICTEVAEVNKEVLKFGPTKYPAIYIPRYHLPHEDLSEVFSISFTLPPSCKSSMCNIYYYQNYKKESLTITVTGDILNVQLETGEGSPDLVLKKCNNGYVWTENIDVKNKQSGMTVFQQQPVNGDHGITAAMRAVSGPACWYPQEYCNPLHFVISYSRKEEGTQDRKDLVLECYQACQGLSNCQHFTYMSIRKKGTCYLLSDCKTTSDTCLILGTCVSGPSDCAARPDNGKCAPPPQMNGNFFSKWQCIDKEARKIGPVVRNPNATLPSGTVCLQSCGHWKTEAKPDKPQATGYLESRCENSGNWSKTLPFGNTSLEFPLGPYPNPDATLGDQVKPLLCTCQPLLLDTNPNLEEGADFTCKQKVDWNQEEYVVFNNECHLFCDGILAVTLKCLEDGWTGQPEDGFWCFQEPGSSLDNAPRGIIDIPEPRGIFQHLCVSCGASWFLWSMNLKDKKLVRDQSKNIPKPEEIEWTQCSQCFSWKGGKYWYSPPTWSCKCKKKYFLLDYYIYGDTTKVYKVYIAKDDLNIPDEFQTDGRIGNKQSNKLHYGLLEISGGSFHFFVLHDEKWGPYQHRFKISKLTNFFAEANKLFAGYVVGQAITGVVGSFIPANMLTDILTGLFGDELSNITDDIFGNYLRFIG